MRDIDLLGLLRDKINEELASTRPESGYVAALRREYERELARVHALILAAIV